MVFISLESRLERRNSGSIGYFGAFKAEFACVIRMRFHIK
jgi:hypothetical protein